MSMPLPSRRRLGLLAGILCLALLASAGILRVNQQPAALLVPSASTLARPILSDQILISNEYSPSVLTNNQPQEGQDTAVLFLIDESGGVSGKCEQADSTNVFVTDGEEGSRYELVRFYFQLWRAYDKFLADQENTEDHAPSPIQVGIAQFAKRDELHELLSISPIGSLSGSAGAYAFERLQRQDDLLAGRDANWFCWTDFASALDVASERLEASGAAKKVLVLLTDGSSRGSETEQETEAVRSGARETTEQALRRLKDSNIEMLVTIWQGSNCIIEDTCELSEDEFRLRKDDLARWKSWEADELLTLVDDDQVIKKLAATSAFMPLMPGSGRFATGWIDQSNDYRVQQPIPAVTEDLFATIVTSRDISNDVISAESMQVDHFRPQWYRVTGSVPTHPSDVDCPQRTVEFEIDDETTDTEPIIAYYWLASNQGWPRIQSIGVQPNSIVIDRIEAGQIPSTVRSGPGC